MTTNKDTTSPAASATSQPPSTTSVPSVRTFYDGLYHSPLYAEHHKICCNVGFSAVDDAVGSAPTMALPAVPAAEKFHAAHHTDAPQLALYRALLSLLPPTDTHALQSSSSSSSSSATASPPVQIMDVGCGAGGGLCELQSLFPAAHVTGVDISQQALARAHETWTRFTTHAPDTMHTRSLTLLHESCEHLRSVATASVDVVCAVQTLQEVQRLPRALAELTRVLKPNGWLLIADFIPQDATDDRIDAHLLAPLASASASSSSYTLVHESLVSLNAALACAKSSPALAALIATHVPRAFHTDMRAFFFVEPSQQFEQLRRDVIGYRLVALQRCAAALPLPTDPVASVSHTTTVDGIDGLESDADSTSDSDSDDIFDADLPNYYDYTDIFPQLEVLKDAFDVIRTEMQQVLATSTWPFWPEKHYGDGDNEWRVFPFCYTFPAHDARKTTWVAPTCALCPQTVAVLQRIPGLRTALFSKLGPGTTLSPHRGWADLSNHILRCHLGLVVPTYDDNETSTSCCSMVVGGERRAHCERELLVFDDSKLHFAFNRHADATRIVLIVDLYRPEHLPRGRAKGGHSDELDEFIETFGQQMGGGGGDDDDDEGDEDEEA